MEFRTVERKRCPVCSSEQHTYLFSACDDRYGQPDRFPVVRCDECNLAYLRLAVHPADQDRLYARYYPHRAPSRRAGRWNPSALWHLARRLDGNVNPMRFISSSDRVLDVGAGQGTLLEQVTSIGARGEGFEIDQRASQALNETGLCCHSGSLADVVRNSSGRYTVVVLNQVLEHSLAPDEMLRDCLRLLASDGRIVVATPVHGSHMQRRYGTRWINWHVPYHVNWFSTCALRLLVRRCGLRVQELHVSTPNSWFLAQRELHRAVRKGRRFRDFSTEYPSWRRLLVAPVVRAIDIARTGDAMLAVLVPRNGEVC